MYYTYAHYNLNGDLFYIGKGKGNRAFSHGDRSREWKDYVYKTDGITIKIVERWNTEEEAYKHEMALIEYSSIPIIPLIQQELSRHGDKTNIFLRNAEFIDVICYEVMSGFFEGILHKTKPPTSMLPLKRPSAEACNIISG
jgi:hypothetical protein